MTVVGTLFAALVVFVALLRVLHFLFTQLLVGFSQNTESFAHILSASPADVRVTLSTVSTRLITITTFYLKDSLTIARGIS